MNILQKMDGISDMKRIILQKSIKDEKVTVKIKMEPTYRCDDPTKIFSPIVKKGKAIHLVPELSAISPYSRVSEAKKTDVNNLLSKRFGDDWRSMGDLDFYANIIDAVGIVTGNEGDDTTTCGCLDEEGGLNNV